MPEYLKRGNHERTQEICQNYANGPSLAEINGTVKSKNNSFWKNILAFSGPGALVAVGYMDPGNWITSIGGGAQYGYLLLSVVLVSSLIAKVARNTWPLNLVLLLVWIWHKPHANILAKNLVSSFGSSQGLRSLATDIAEVIGGAIALNLLFGLPIIWGVILTVFDVTAFTLLDEARLPKNRSHRHYLISVIMIVFVYEVAISDPVIADMLKGFIPQKEIFDRSQLTMALGIVGATVTRT